MKATREMDRVIAQRVMGHIVSQQKREVFESTPKGTRPLAYYTSDINAAWEVAERMAITLVPVEGGSWFALVGRGGKRWESPADFVQFLAQSDFIDAGAAVGEDPAMTICAAALKAVENRELREQGDGLQAGPAVVAH